MLFTLPYLAVALSVLTLSSALPLDGAHKPLAPRSKTYAIVNVDGGSTAAETTTIVEETVKTKTVRVTDVATAVTNKVTTVVIETPPPSTTSQPSSTTLSWGEPFHLTPAPTSESKSTSTPTLSNSTSISFSLISKSESTPQPPITSSIKPSSTAEPSIVTVVVAATPSGQPQYYDNGLWHTSYLIKTFEAPTTQTNSVSTQSTTYTTTISSTSIPPFPTLETSSIPSYNHTQIPTL